MPKVFMFYKKGEKSPYAYTINTEYYNLFKSQRNMSLIFTKEIHMDKYEFMIFTNKNKSLQLIEDYLYDGENDITIIATVEESAKLSESCEYIFSTADTIERSLKNVPLKKKYLNSILSITQELKRRNKKTPTLCVNTFTLFYYLFRDTFSEVSLEIQEKEK